MSLIDRLATQTDVVRDRIIRHMTKCVKVLQAKANAKSMDQSQARIWVGTLIRACDWSMLSAYAR
jgi:hypothetical protein